MTIIKKSDVKSHLSTRSKRLLFAVKSKAEIDAGEPSAAESPVADLEKISSEPVAAASRGTDKDTGSPHSTEEPAAGNTQK